jgi:hypothetical protein
MTEVTQGGATQEVGITVEIESEKPVDFDVAELLKSDPDQQRKDKEAAAVVKDEPAEPKEDDPGVEIEVPIGGDAAKVEPDAAAELKAQLEELRAKMARDQEETTRERSLREAAEQRAQQVHQEMGRREFELFETRRHAIENAIAARKSDADALERTLAMAARSNDHATSAKAQRTLMRIEAELLQLDEGLGQVKNITDAGVDAFLKYRESQQPRQSQTTPSQQPKQQAQKPLTREDYLAQRTPRVRQFLESKDPSWITDDKMNKKLIAAHWDALSQGFVEESDGYFDHIGKTMEPPKKAEPKPAELKPSKKAVPAAPNVAKAVAAPNGVNGTKVHLTPRERERAKDLNLTEAEYARRKYLMSQPNWDGPRFD